MEAGPAEARNAGALAAGGDVLVFVESTCFPTATRSSAARARPEHQAHLEVLDPWRPGVPWVVLLMRRRRAPRELNLGRRHRLSTAAWVAGASAIAIRRPRIAAVARRARGAGPLAIRAAVATRCAGKAAAGVGLLALHHLTAAAAVPLGALAWARDRPWESGQAQLEGLRFVLHAQPPRRWAPEGEPD